MGCAIVFPFASIISTPSGPCFEEAGSSSVLNLPRLRFDFRPLERRVGECFLDDLPVLDRARDGILVAELAGELARRPHPEVRLKVRHAYLDGGEVIEP